MSDLPLIDQIFEKAKLRALARGTSDAQWYDIWVGMAQLPSFKEVFRTQGISTDSLTAEMTYIENFAPTLLRDEGVSEEDVIALLEEISDDLGVLELSGAGLLDNSNDRPVFAFFSELLHKRLMEQTLLTKGSQEARQRLHLKARLIGHIVGTASTSIEPANPEHTEIFKALQNVITQTLHIKLVSRDIDTLIKADPVQQLADATLGPDQTDKPLAIELFEAAKNLSGSVYVDLLHRNGMRTNDADRQDPLADTLPCPAVMAVMLNALKLASSENAAELTPAHILLSALHMPKIGTHLKKIGIEDLSAFEDKITSALLPSQTDAAQHKRVFVRTQVGQAALAMIDTLNKAYLGKNRTEDLVPALAESTPELAKALTAAGLTRKMQRDWRKKYDKKSKETPARRAERDTEHNVSDEQLEQLIAEYCVDFTALARRKKFDPMIGNTATLDKIATILLKRGKKNPILVGDPAVGKTKMLEALAQAMVAGKVPKRLIGGRLLMLDLHAMNNSPFVGVFESKLKPLLSGIAQRNAQGDAPPILLGIDEFAEAQDAGGHSNSPGFKGMVKPYLTAGDMFMITATTLNEYRTKVEKDPALARRLQPVFLTAPSDEETAQILQGLTERYEVHHGVSVPQELFAAISALAGRYIHTVNQPDKSIDLMDEALAVAQRAGDQVLSKRHVLQVVSHKTNIPQSFLDEDEFTRYAGLEAALATRVFGQNNAVRTVASAIKRAKVGFKSGTAPIANFLFIGPSGVGKTELTKAMADQLTGNADDFLVRFDMSEFHDKHQAARFIGASAGHVGYEDGGELVKAVRNKPFGIYLYDEIEKADPGIFNILLAPFSDGIITDSRGISGDMRHTINIMTSNLGAEAVRREGERQGLDPVKDHEAWQKMARPIYQQAVESFFKPEFLNRLDGVIYFDSLTPDVMAALTDRLHAATTSTLQTRHGFDLDLNAAFRSAVMRSGFDIRYGARPLKRAWQNAVETPLADWLLANQGKIKSGATLTLSRANTNDNDLSAIVTIARKGSAPPAKKPPRKRVSAKPR